MTKNILSLLLVICFYVTGSSQTVTNFCAHNQEHYERVKTDLAYKKLIDSVNSVQNAHLHEYMRTKGANRSVLYIPVVYHILHEGGIENISDEQIHSDIVQMNNMFRKLNTSVSNVHSSFAPIAADIEIEFRLAQKKNDGSCFSGITRTYSPATQTGGNQAVSHVRSLHGDFPGDKYLNIFVSKEIGGAAGYTFKPNGDTTMNNGIHILHTYVGTIGTSTQIFENATSAHEAGHWMNLDHTWGPTNSPTDTANCNFDDSVADTPLTIGWNTCNVNGITCGSLDNVENIMEYSYCPNHMFTEGQKDRMRAAITSPISNRMNVVSPSNHTATGIFDDIMCTADFTADNQSICVGQQIQFFDNSSHNPTGWNWSFPGGTPSTSTLQNPTVTYANVGYYDVYLQATNANGSADTTISQFVLVNYGVGINANYSENFEVPANKKWFSKGTSVTGWNNTSITSYSGNNCAMLENYSINDGNTISFYSPQINLQYTTTSNLTFQYSYAQKTTTGNENLRLYITRDCGQTWLLSKVLTPTVSDVDVYFTGNLPSHWSLSSVVIPPTFRVPNFQFKVELLSGGGNNIYIDDINLTATAGIDENNAFNYFDVYPNPTNSTATISFELSNAATISIDLLDVSGRKVKTVLTNQVKSSGAYSQELTKEGLNSGVYFLRSVVNGKVNVEKLVFN